MDGMEGKRSLATRSLVCQAQVGVYGGRGAGTHARASAAVNHGSKEHRKEKER